jgi:hypothetical protein
VIVVLREGERQLGDGSGSIIASPFQHRFVLIDFVALVGADGRYQK